MTPIVETSPAWTGKRRTDGWVKNLCPPNPFSNSLGDFLSSIKSFITGTSSIWEDLAPHEHPGGLARGSAGGGGGGGGGGKPRSTSCPRAVRPAVRANQPQRAAGASATAGGNDPTASSRAEMAAGRGVRPTASNHSRDDVIDDWGWGDSSPFKAAAGGIRRAGHPSSAQSPPGGLTPQSGQKGLLDAVSVTIVPGRG